jgi:S1-C subfamily serine protease
MLVVPEPPMAETSDPLELEVLEPFDLPVESALPPVPVAATPAANTASPQPATGSKIAVAKDKKSTVRWPILLGIAGVLVAIFGGALYWVYSTTDTGSRDIKWGGGIQSASQLPKAEASVSQGNTTAATNRYDSGIRNLNASVGKGSAEDLGMSELVKAVDPSIVLLRVTTYDGRQKIGSGFFIDTEGKIVTNNHVIERASVVVVKANDGTTANALGVVHTARDRDLAIIQVDPEEFDCVPIAIADALPEKGDDIAAFGAPQGFEFSYTEGTVSAIRSGHEVSEIIRSMGGISVMDRRELSKDITWIQHSASIAGGNSGGPLVNMRGQMVGVNTWTHQGGQNLNFASTMDQVQEAFSQRPGTLLQFEGAAAVAGQNNPGSAVRRDLPTRD